MSGNSESQQLQRSSAVEVAETAEENDGGEAGIHEPILQPSAVSQSDDTLSSTARARRTFSRRSLTFAVETKARGLSLLAAM